MAPLRAAALCDLGLVAGPLCASFSGCFRWVPASRCAGDVAGRGWRGPRPWWEGGPGGDVTQDSPGPGRSRAGGRGYEGWQPGRAPSARCTGKSAAGDERGGKFGSGGTRRSRAVRGDLRRGSPCRLPVCPRSPAAGSGTLPRVLRASPHSPDRRGRAGRAWGKRPSAPRLTLGSEATGGPGLARGRSLLRWPDRAGC